MRKGHLACILICQNSQCCQSGGKEIYQILEVELSDRGISDRVQIQKTGCQKQCQKAPNLIFRLSNSCQIPHTYVKASQVSSLLDRYSSNYLQ